MKNLSALLFATSGLALVLTGCGKRETTSASGNAGATSSAASTSGTDKSAATDKNAMTPASGRVVEITGNDTMKFSVTEIRAKPGESLTVKLTNVGTMPKLSMGHNWVLLKAANLVDPVIAAAPQAASTNYVPDSHKNDIIAHTKLLGPKESDSVTFQAPKEPGHYPFFCSFPGHYQVGMKGELIVE